MKKLYLLLAGLFLASSLLAQVQKAPKLPRFNKHKEKNVFLNKQWFLGFKAGANLSGTKVMQSYSAVSPVNYPASDIKKQYSNYSDVGAQATLEATFYFTGLSLSVQPTY